MIFDYLIVGAGFSGSVVAERLASSGHSVLLVDRRPHIGGNAFDEADASGVMVHRYGPHIFHTNSDDVISYLSRFTEWRHYEHRVRASVRGRILPLPINLDTINGLYDWNLDSAELEAYFAQVAEPRAEIRTSEDVIVSKVGRELYGLFFQNYTRKQWGLDPSELDASVIARIPTRTNRDDRYFTDQHQVMPKQGFTALFEAMLHHPKIVIELGAEYRSVVKYQKYRSLVFTGPVDEYFGYCYGRLPYRSLDFRFETRAGDVVQPVAVINHPNEHAYTRVTEFRHLTGQVHDKTTLVYEFPKGEGDPYYPIPRPANAALYQKYRALAEKTPNVHFVGRLGTYRYYNMDQVVAQALTLSAKLKGVRRNELLSDGVGAQQRVV